MDIVGMVPIVGNLVDITNGVIHALRGNWGSAVLSFGSAIPVLGQGFKLQFLERLENVLKNFE